MQHSFLSAFGPTSSHFIRYCCVSFFFLRLFFLEERDKKEAKKINGFYRFFSHNFCMKNNFYFYILLLVNEFIQNGLFINYRIALGNYI